MAEAKRQRQEREVRKRELEEEGRVALEAAREDEQRALVLPIKLLAVHSQRLCKLLPPLGIGAPHIRRCPHGVVAFCEEVEELRYW